MRPIYSSVLTAPGVSALIPLDLHPTPADVGLYLIIVGTATATVEFTGDDIQARGYNPATGNWFPVPDLTGSTASEAAKLPIPARAVRLNVASVTGSVQLQVISQGG